MICKSCGRDNKNEAQFCASCGVNLLDPGQPNKIKRCSQCGFENEPHAKYCAKCGGEIHRAHQHTHQEQHHDAKLPKKKDKRVNTSLKWNPAFVVVAILGGVTLLIAIPFIRGYGPGQQRAPVPISEQRSNDPAVEAEVLKIAERFICSCGSCGEQPLDVCRCNTAVKEREFIRTALQSGGKEQQIIASVNSTFGWMKPEYASPADTLARKTRKPVVLTVPQQNANPPLLPTGEERTKIATVADRQGIFEHFKCSCGQCGIEELKDCDCGHPRGAKEVKSYVDLKLLKGTYTVAQVIADVEQRYGGRKF